MPVTNYSDPSAIAEFLKTVKLTNAQIKALDGTDVDLVFQPLSNCIAVPRYVLLTSNILTAYTNLDAAATIQVEYSGISFRWLTVLDNAVGTQIADFLAVGKHFAILIPSANTGADVGNLASHDSVTDKLVISMTNGSAGALTAGADGNVVFVQVFFNNVVIPDPAV